MPLGTQLRLATGKPAVLPLLHVRPVPVLSITGTVSVVLIPVCMGSDRHACMIH